jgi:hypothetical protein
MGPFLLSRLALFAGLQKNLASEEASYKNLPRFSRLL